MNITREKKENALQKSFVNVTNDREAYPKRWIAVLVQMNCEKQTCTKLNKAGFETFIPIQKEIHQWSDRKKKIERLIIPMVIFVRATIIEEEWIRNQSYIYKLISLPGSIEATRKLATHIPDYQIDRFKFLLQNAETEVSIANNLEIGNNVRIISGPLKGLEGIVNDTDDNHSIVGVVIDGLGYACVKVDKNHVKITN